MRAIQFEKPGAARLIELPAPSPPAGWARIRVRAAAICMTDFEVLEGRIAADYPLIPGHEWSGVVDAVGSASDEPWLGRRVTGDNEITCCPKGRLSLCRHSPRLSSPVHRCPPIKTPLL